MWFQDPVLAKVFDGLEEIEELLAMLTPDAVQRTRPLAARAEVLTTAALMFVHGTVRDGEVGALLRQVVELLMAVMAEAKAGAVAPMGNRGTPPPESAAT